MTPPASHIDAIARYVSGLELIQPVVNSPWSYGHATHHGYYRLPEVATLAETMLADSEFRALELGT